MENVVERRFRSFQNALAFMAGLTLGLAVTFLTGDLAFGSIGFPFGWTVLWLVSLIGCLPLGVVMLIGPSWRTLPLARRRGTAVGFLAIGLVDLVTVALGAGFLLWGIVLAYALVMLLAVVATQPPRSRPSEELFP